MSKLDFQHAPVVEVALSASFKYIFGLTQAHVGAFWQSIAGQFPRQIDQAPAQIPSVPWFPTPASLVINNLPQLRRSWFMSRDDSRLVQLQADWISFNWRLTGSDYPHFEALRLAFANVLSSFATYLKSHQVGSLDFTSFELAYTNTFSLGDRHLTYRGSDLLPTSAHGDDSPNNEDPRLRQQTFTWLEEVAPHAGLAALITQVSRGEIASPPIRTGDDTFLQLIYREAWQTEDLDATNAVLEHGHHVIETTFDASIPSWLQHRWGRTDA